MIRKHVTRIRYSKEPETLESHWAPTQFEMTATPGAVTTLRDYTPGDLRNVMALDRSAFKGFMLGRLGTKYVAQYYQLIASYPRRIFVVAEAPSGEMAGFAAGFVWPTKFYAHMSSAGVRLVAAALPALVSKPLMAQRALMGSKTSSEDGGPMEPARCELASIAVHPAYARRGIGRHLVDAFADRAAKMSAEEVRLTTRARDNDKANRFYQSLGFTLVGVIDGRGQQTLNDYRLSHILR